MTDFGVSISNLKAAIAEAKLARDEARQTGDDELIEEAIELLDQAVSETESSDWRSADITEEVKVLAWRLSDCYGMLGGNQRRLRRFSQALKSFARGAELEEDSRYDIPSSYNLVNGIVLPIEIPPGSEESKTAEDQKDILEKAVAVLERQVRGNRRVDMWAWADLAQCKLLLRDTDGGLAAYRRFQELADSTALQSAASVLVSLERALAIKDDPAAGVVQRGVEFLGARAKVELA